MFDLTKAHIAHVQDEPVNATATTDVETINIGHSRMFQEIQDRNEATRFIKRSKRAAIYVALFLIVILVLINVFG